MSGRVSSNQGQRGRPARASYQTSRRGVQYATVNRVEAQLAILMGVRAFFFFFLSRSVLWGSVCKECFRLFKFSLTVTLGSLRNKIAGKLETAQETTLRSSLRPSDGNVATLSFAFAPSFVF